VIDPFAAISVVIPCYNATKFLRSTLDSVLAQTLPALEVIVVDDGSTDDSAAIAESYGPPIRVIRQPNQGESVARNRGIAEAKGDWLAFLDADDWWLPEKLAEQAKLMSLPVAAICSGNIERYADQREHNHIPRAEFLRRSKIMEYGAPCHISTLLVRRDLPVRFPTWTTWSEDILYYLDLLQHTPIAIAAQPLVVYRIHAGGQTANPAMGERRDASLRRWLEINKDTLPQDELTEQTLALQRREKWSLLSRALMYRRQKKPGAALAVYVRLFLQSMNSPSSLQIVTRGMRNFLGALAECVRLRKHPV
jgi:glycosyltransferase involved in cell wall biosynthesis